MSRKELQVPRVAPKELEILALLRGAERYGLELVDRSDGSIKRGSVYVLLGRLEERALVTSRAESRKERATGLPRRLYALTALGEAVLAADDAARAVLARKGVLA